VLPLSTTKTGVAGRVNQTWGLVIICVGLGILA
jgi:hypothetical protein